MQKPKGHPYHKSVHQPCRDLVPEILDLLAALDVRCGSFALDVFGALVKDIEIRWGRSMAGQTSALSQYI
jgi:hypothetical protein